jgi:hypothetical protein
MVVILVILDPIVNETSFLLGVEDSYATRGLGDAETLRSMDLNNMRSCGLINHCLGSSVVFSCPCGNVCHRGLCKYVTRGGQGGPSYVTRGGVGGRGGDYYVTRGGVVGVVIIYVTGGGVVGVVIM